MKRKAAFLYYILTFFLVSCNKESNNIDYDSLEDIYDFIKQESYLGHDILIPMNKIKSFNQTTREIVFTDSIHQEVCSRRYFKMTLYLDNNKIVFKQLNIISSQSRYYYYNDLSVVVDESKCYLFDGYPAIDDEKWPKKFNEIIQGIRDDCVKKRKKTWGIFIQYLKDTRKLVK